MTRLLAAWSQGDRAALEELTRLVYEELRRLAHRYMGRQPAGHTLQTTALVNEAYLRLANQEQPSFANRSHFLAVAATAMRQILVDHAKASLRQKRGGGASDVALDEAALVLARADARARRPQRGAGETLGRSTRERPGVVELSYFGGLKQDEIAEVLKISTVTVRRDWVFPRAWLYSELRNAGPPGY